MLKKLSLHLSHKPHKVDSNKQNESRPPVVANDSFYGKSHYTHHLDTTTHSDSIRPPSLTIDHDPVSPASPSPLTPSQDIESLIQDGITFHERGQLEKATSLFRVAAEKDNPLGMFLYGVSLRHGWGCKKNEHLAFQYLQKAAEHAVEDLTNITNAVSASASKGELVMAIYELGVSFKHGWGCKKNKESAAYFFKIAADLGDPDAQNDIAHCYNQGIGVKKDLYMAAKYYRKADKQGQGIMGNSWIWKPKYDPK
ncbi:HCP-like protein [Rhizopus microsporus var. microsporus]|nr:HCP-like protein [Rhizopus microsporus var. microsporus]